MDTEKIKAEIMVYVSSPIGRTFMSQPKVVSPGKVTHVTVLCELPEVPNYLVDLMENGHLADPWSLPLGNVRASVYATECARMYVAMTDLRESLMTSPDACDEDVWRLLLRGAVACRISAAPGCQDLKRYNALMGLADERKHKTKPTRIWAPLSTEAGLIDALASLLQRLHIEDLGPYFAAIVPRLRRTTKPNQEPRHGC